MKAEYYELAALRLHLWAIPLLLASSAACSQPPGEKIYRIILRYSFMDEIDVPATLANVEGAGPTPKMMDTSFFLARQTLVPSAAQPGMALWRERLLAWMLRKAESAMEFFKLPPNRVIELGSQVEI